MNKSIFAKISSASLRLALVVFAVSIIYSLVSLVSYGTSDQSLPAFFRIPKMSSRFADLALLTHSSGCRETYQALLTNQANCDPWSRPFNYTNLSLSLFRLFDIDAADTPLIGLLMGIVAITACTSFVFTISKPRRSALWILALFISSFPFQLALERGNFDLMILILTLMIIMLLYTRLRIILPVLAFGATALKIFPALGLAPWSTILLFGKQKFSSNRDIGWLISFLVLIATILGISFQLMDIPTVLANTPKPDGSGSFGLLASYQSRFGFKLAAALTIAKVVILAVSARWAFVELNSHKGFHKIFSVDKSCQSASLFGIMMVLIYLGSRSWDYRLIFCIGFLPAAFNALHRFGVDGAKSLILLCSSWFFILYEQYASGALGKTFHILSDIVVQPIAVGILSAFVLVISRPLSASVSGTTRVP